VFVVLTGSSSAIGPGGLLFLMPCFAIGIFGGWLTIAELRMRRPRSGPV
jgi:hypothetical protein